GPDRHLDDQVAASRAGPVRPGAALAAGRAEMLGVAEVDQRIEARHGLEDDVAALAALAAVRPAILDELLTPEADCARPPRSGAYENLCLVEEVHARALAGAAVDCHFTRGPDAASRSVPARHRRRCCGRCLAPSQ